AGRLPLRQGRPAGGRPVPPVPPPPGGRPGPQGRRRPPTPERATEHIPTVEAKPSYTPEPALLTHQEAAYGLEEPDLSLPDDGYDQPPPDRPRGGGGGDGPSDPDDRRRKTWRRVRRTVYVLIACGFLAPVITFIVLYQFVAVPNPNALVAQLNQPVTLYYGDGSVMYTKSSGSNSHQLATWDQIPDSIKNAAMAAEDETFMTNSGFDLKAIVRTVYNQLMGGTGGGSTITQEYVKKATGNDQRTLTRKVTEVVEAFKMNRTYSKQDVLAAYLNTVYFGRGAYGVKAAAQAFYGEDLSKLNNEQASLLAGMIQLPSYADDAKYEQKRYTYVMGRMLANHWVSQAEYSSAQFPTPISDSADSADPSAPKDRQYIVNEVFAELQQKGYSEQVLSKSGAKIYTTIQPGAQTMAENAVNQVLAADTQFTKAATNPEGAALVSVDPTTGKIIAYYGGDGTTYYDLAMTPQQAGSAFKPYVFAAALQANPPSGTQQVGLNTLYNGSDNQVIDGQVVHNSDGEGSPQMTVWDAMTQSVNTVFYNMGYTTGVSKVRQAAWDAGIPQQITASLGGKTYASLQQDNADGSGTGITEAGISIGQYAIRPIDQAQGYATFANNGMYIPVHFVDKVTDNSGGLLYQFNTVAKQAFSSDPSTNASIAATVTASLTKVAQSSYVGLSRPNAAKTGTQDYKLSNSSTGHNADAWMVGFTPQVVTSVWFGHVSTPAPVYGLYKNPLGRMTHTETNGKAAPGYDVYGREEPGYIWQAYMNAYLADKPTAQFSSSPLIMGGGNESGMPTTDTATPPTTADNGGADQSTANDTQTTTAQPTTTEETTASGGCLFGCTTTTGVSGAGGGRGDGYGGQGSQGGG
ncbi:MAG TPA: transglycosylase domain-containing protein, partial [Pseudonocardiaceae bacterium]